MLEEIIAYGHQNITARHRTTMEVTKDSSITLRADCIIGVRSNKAVSDLSDELKRHLVEGGSVQINLIVKDMTFSLSAWGDPGLKLTNNTDAVIRKSTYIDDRTLAVRSNFAARDIPRRMVKALKDPRTMLLMEIIF